MIVEFECAMCNGRKEVVRPIRVKTVIIKRPYRTENGYAYEDREEKIIIGGTDACSNCAEKAEIEYRNGQ